MLTTDIVLLCELNPPMLVNWSNQQKTAKTDSVERMPQSGLCPPARGGGDLEMVQIDPGREHWTLAARPRELDRYSILTLISSKNQ